MKNHIQQNAVPGSSSTIDIAAYLVKLLIFHTEHHRKHSERANARCCKWFSMRLNLLPYLFRLGSTTMKGLLSFQDAKIVVILAIDEDCA